mmetsp:Transcript_8608/g.18941  ORF Transcript_8608/g.18941 Transcript_8608/m.18941 type:complete len:141 (+) Transcript_8608:172-594(+)
MIILFLFITFILLLANDPLRPTQYFVDSFSFVPSITYRQRALPCTFRRSTTVRSSSFSLTGYEPNPLYDENPPLANGIDSVKWMEPCDVTARRESAKVRRRVLATTASKIRPPFCSFCLHFYCHYLLRGCRLVIDFGFKN